MPSRFLSLLLVAVCVLAVGGCTRFVEYTPAEFVHQGGDHAVVLNAELLSPGHIQAMTSILSKYGEQYRLEDGRLLIPATLQNDLELLANYTQKAVAVQERGR